MLLAAASTRVQPRLYKTLTRTVFALLLLGLVSACSAEAKKSRFFQRAEDYFKSGEYNKAKIEYLNLLRLDPQNTIAYERLGTIWLEEGAPLRAGPFLLKAREFAPKDLKNRIQLARVFLSIGDAKNARKEVINVLGQSPHDEDAIVLLAETDRTKEEIAYTEQELQKFQGQNSASYFLALASLDFQKGDTTSAENNLRQAAQLNPKSPDPHLALATAYLLAKNSDAAGIELKQAAELAPVRSVAKVKFAEFKAQIGALDEARQLVNQITNKAPDFLPAWMLSAKIAFSKQKYQEAASLLENVFSQDSENIDARMLQAQIWLGQNEVRKATDSLEKLSKAYPGIPGIPYQLATLYLRQNKFEEAANALKRAITLYPDYVEAILLLAQLEIRSGDTQSAIPAVNDLLKKRPGLLPAQLILAEAYHAAGRLDDAVAVLQAQISTASPNAQSYYMLGLIFRQQNKNDEARQAFEKARTIAPDNVATLDQLVQIDIAAKDFAAATEKAQKELERVPKSAAAHLVRAKVYAAEKKWSETEAVLQKALDLDPNLSVAYDLLISVYLAEGKLKEAIGRLESLLTKNPKNAAALMTVAMLYEQTKNSEKAKDAYEKLLAVNPNFVPALNNLAYLFANRLKNPDKAYDLAMKARQLQPSDASVADTLGWILYKKADYSHALNLLQESAGKLGDNAEVQFHLGMANYMMGQIEPAKKALERAAASATDFPGKDDCKRRLALLENKAEMFGEASIDELKKLLEEQPNDPIALQRMGGLYEKRGAFTEAASAYEQALKFNSKLIAPTIKLAQLNAGPLKSPDKAMVFAKKARELAPMDLKVTALLGAIAYQVGKFDWAYSLLQKGVRGLPDDMATRQMYAWAAYSLGKMTEAKQSMQTILKTAHDPKRIEDAKSFLSMIALNETSTDLTASEPKIQRILGDDPDNVPALMVKAKLAKQRHDDKAAQDIYRHVLERYPDFTPAEKNLAALFSNDSALLNKAYDLAVAARKQTPEDTDLTELLAEISYKKKDFTYAVQLLNDVAGKRPLDNRGLYYLGMSSLQLKQNAAGRDALQRALQAGLQEPLADEAKRALAQPQ